MKKISFLFLAVILSFAACNKTNKQSKAAGGQSDTSAINGVYNGTLPCADCSGIKTTLKFEPQNIVEKSTLYMGQSDSGQTVKGTYKINNSTIVVDLPNEDTEYYRIKSDTSILMLNSNKKEVSGPLAKKYILTKKGS